MTVHEALDQLLEAALVLALVEARIWLLRRARREQTFDPSEQGQSIRSPGQDG
jgi:flagellar biogenesis protein FliO